jgi:hypothetical protein
LNKGIINVYHSTLEEQGVFFSRSFVYFRERQKQKLFTTPCKKVNVRNYSPCCVVAQNAGKSVRGEISSWGFFKYCVGITAKTTYTYVNLTIPLVANCKCLVPIYVFPEMKLCALLFPKQNVLSPNFHNHLYICEWFIYSQDRFAYFAAPNRLTEPGSI